MADDATQTAIETINRLENVCIEYSQNATKSGPQLRKQMIELLVQLRLLHLDNYALLNESKQTTHRAKISADAVLLDIQNIQYQHRHIRRQIEQCEDFKCNVGDISMSPVDKFLAEHPEFNRDTEMEVEDANAPSEKENDNQETHANDNQNQREAAASAEFRLTVARLKDEEEKRLKLFMTKNRLQEQRSKLLAQVKQLQDKAVDTKALEGLLTKYIDTDSAALRKFFA